MTTQARTYQDLMASMSTTDLASVLGCSLSQASLLRAGKRRMQMHHVASLMAWVGLDALDLRRSIMDAYPEAFERAEAGAA